MTDLRVNDTDSARAILRNIALILTTPKGTVPMYRDFGIDTNFLDKPPELAFTYMLPRVKEAIEEWEPRAQFVRMVRKFDEQGHLVPTVEVELNE